MSPSDETPPSAEEKSNKLPAYRRQQRGHVSLVYFCWAKLITDMITVTLIAALFSLGLTLFILWANPFRFSNQVFAVALLIQTAWLGCVFRAMQIGASGSMDTAMHLEWWFRANAAVISFVPPMMWLLQWAIVVEKGRKRNAIYQSFPIFLLSLFSVLLCSLPSFVWKDQLGILHRGPPYYIYSLIGLTVYGLCIVSICRKLMHNTGIRRVELQFIALNAGGAALVLLGLNALGNLLENRSLNRLSVVLLFASSALTACALLLHRVFNAWEVFLQLAQRLSFAIILCGGIYVLWRATNDWFAEPFGLLLSIAVFSPVAVWLDRQSRTWFDFSGDLKMAELRQQAIEIERTEPQTEQLAERLTTLLCVKFETQSAHFLANNGSVHGQNDITISKDRSGYQLLCQLGWATPESLDRRRSTCAIDDLKDFLGINSLGLVLPVPRGSPAPSLLVALGTRSDERPYTFPEIERIQSLAELIESILSRSKLAAQAAFYARTEYLSMMSRGLAHDLKNLITPVSAFLLHTNRWSHTSPVEAGAYSAAQSATKAMTEYVRETLSFSDQLEPSFEHHRLKDICTAVYEVTRSSAQDRNVKVDVVVSEFESIVADGVLIQRLLGNLVLNAIDASSAGQVVVIQVIKLQPGWVRIDVRDNGCGIPIEHMGKILDPYFTTKKSGGNVRGIGLGLTIAHKITLLHRGNISVRSKPGQQTIVTVDLPIDQPRRAARPCPAHRRPFNIAS